VTRGIAWLLLTTLAVTGGCTLGRTQVEQDAGRSGPVLGARPETFGVADLGETSGSRRTPSGLEVRWETVGNVPKVVGVAELWDAAAREVVSGQGLAPAAFDYARRFGGPDAEFVTRTVLGGVDVFQYRSASLRSTFRRSADAAARAGRFLVAVTLAPGQAASPDRAIATDPTDPRRVPAGTFSIAVLAGNPWAEGARGTNAAAPATAGPVRIVLSQSSYRPSTVAVRAGEALLLSLENPDAQPHDLNLLGLAEPVHLFLNGRKAVVSSVTFPRPGRYPFFCSLAGHQAAGMEGEVVVEG
jgi:plastocyanin